MTSFPIESLMCRRDNLEHVLDNLKEGIIAHDPQRRIFFFNREAERITGYGRNEVVGETVTKPSERLSAADVVRSATTLQRWRIPPSTP